MSKNNSTNPSSQISHSQTNSSFDPQDKKTSLIKINLMKKKITDELNKQRQESGSIIYDQEHILELKTKRKSIQTKIKESKQILKKYIQKHPKAKQILNKIQEKQIWLYKLKNYFDNLQEQGLINQQNKTYVDLKTNQIYSKAYQKLHNEDRQKLNIKIMKIRQKEVEKQKKQKEIKQQKSQGITKFFKSLISKSPSQQKQIIQKDIGALQKQAIGMKLNNFQDAIDDAKRQVMLSIQLDKASKYSYYGIQQFAENGIKEIEKSTFENV